MRLRLLAFFAVAATLILAGCGGGHHGHHASRTKSLSVPAKCLPGQSFMGCSVARPIAATPKPLTVPAGRLFPDVSSYQGHPNWAAAKPHISGAVAKAFEYHEDPDFAYNVAVLKAQRLPWGAYDFVRFCDASGFIAVLRSVGGPTSLPPVIDMEVPAAAGCAPALDRQIFAAFHRHADIYTSPGSWPGGSNAGLPVWEATFGSSFSPVWHPVLAWQFTDGKWGSTVFIPGIGQGDVSVDYGFLEQVPNLNPVCYTHRLTASQCAQVKAKVASQQRAAASSQRAYVVRGCPVLSQRIGWFGSHLNKPPASRHAYRAGALAASKRVYQRQACGVFSQRVNFFTGVARRLAAAS